MVFNFSRGNLRFLAPAAHIAGFAGTPTTPFPHRIHIYAVAAAAVASALIKWCFINLWMLK